MDDKVPRKNFSLCKELLGENNQTSSRPERDRQVGPERDRFDFALKSIKAEKNQFKEFKDVMSQTRRGREIDRVRLRGPIG